METGLLDGVMGYDLTVPIATTRPILADAKASFARLVEIVILPSERECDSHCKRDGCWTVFGEAHGVSFVVGHRSGYLPSVNMPEW
jgi:hypothetical protein